MEREMEGLLSRGEGVEVEEVIRAGTEGNPADTARLRDLKTRLQTLADTSTNNIRKNVVSNYSQFIETAKEISYLESEMYQLNHLLTQQKDLIEGMMNFPFSVTGQEREVKSRSRTSAVDNRKSLQSVLERVEGCGYLSEDANRHLLMDSELSELNPDTGRKQRQIHAFLLSDTLLLCSFLPHRAGAKRYKLDQQLSLESLAVGSLEDSARTRHAFKLLVFPQHRLLAAESAQMKRSWVSGVEAAKQAILHEGSLARQGTIRSKFGSVKAKSPAPKPDVLTSTRRRSSEDQEALENMEWLRELPDEIEVCIAQREFQTCLELLEEGRTFLDDCMEESVKKEISAKLTQKERQLVQVLARELRAAGDRSGPKAARKAIQLLIKLGKSSYACDLYLKERRRVLHAAAAELRIAEEPLSYLRSLCTLVLGTLAEVSFLLPSLALPYPGVVEVGRELPALFAGNSGCCAMLCSWSSGELSHAVHLVLRHIIDPGPSLAVVAQAARILHTNTANLAPLGLDLTFQLHALLQQPMLKALAQNEQNILDASRLRLSEDRWRPYNLQSEAGLHKLLEEMHELGLPLDSLVVEDPLSSETETSRCRLWLSAETVQTGRSCLQLCRDSGALSVLPDLRAPAMATVLALWDLLLAHIHTGLSAKDKPPLHYQVAEASAKFIIGDLMPKCEESLKGLPETPTPLQSVLATQYPALAMYRPPPQSFEILGEV